MIGSATTARKMSVHLVNIAEPKDGPSAGLAFALAMLSAVTGRPIIPAFAVTGELSIHGNVNAVGGITEKLSAALQHGRKIMIIPASSAVELARLPDLTAQLDVRPVQTLAEAVAIAIGG
jgi:ATP-dependent Lon protease